MNQRRMTCGCLVLLVVAAVSLAAGCGSGPDGTPAPEPVGEPPAGNEVPGPPPGSALPPVPPGTPAPGQGKAPAEAEVWLKGWSSHLGVSYLNPMPSVFPYPGTRAGGIDSLPLAFGVWPPDPTGLLLLDLQLLLVQGALEEAGVDAASAIDMLSRARDLHSHLPRNWVYLDFDQPVTLPVGTGLSPSSQREGMPGVREVLFVQNEGCDYCTIIFSTAAGESPIVTAVRCPPGWLDQTQAIYSRNVGEALNVPD